MVVNGNIGETRRDWGPFAAETNVPRKRLCSSDRDEEGNANRWLFGYP